jgi:glycosyltransferase involved in cell wall biosynthesis
MNICLISQEYPPDTNWGGIATYTQVLARQLVAMGQRVHVVTLVEKDEYVTDDMGVTVHRVSRTPKSPFDPAALEELGGLNHGLLYFSQRVYEEIREIHDKETIDVIEAPETCAQALLTFKRLKGVKTVTRCHTPFFWVRHLNAMEDNTDHLVRDALEKMQTECSTVVSSPTHAMANVVSKQWRIDNIDVIPNFFNLKTYTPDLSVYEQHLEGKDYILFFGRLEYRKGMHVLVEALPEILDKESGTNIAFIGSDSIYNSVSMKSFMLEKLKGYEDRVTFIENIPHAALYPIIEKSRFVVLPSLWENFPYVCLEAMSLGKAVVASDSGGFPEIIENGKEGILCTPGDPTALKNAIQEALLRTDLKAIGENARQKAQTFDTEIVVKEMLDFYKSIGNKPLTHADNPKIAYILRHIPVPSETFVINEILALQTLGFDIFPVSLLPAQMCHESLMAQIKEEILDLADREVQDKAIASSNYEGASLLAKEYKIAPSLGAQAALVADYVIENGITLLHAHFATESAWVALMASKITGIPFSFTAHAYDIFMRDKRIINEESLEERLKILVGEAARAFTISDHNKEYMVSHTDSSYADKIEIIRCGIDPARFALVARKPKPTVSFLSVGRFVEKKGFEFLLRSFKIVSDTLDNVQLRIIGDGHLRQGMMELAKELGLEDKVVFLGEVSSEIVLQEMHNADVFALHSVTAANGDKEGIPVSIMEASATGLPVVSTHHSGIAELVIDGVTGLLSEERDVDAFANYMIALAMSPQLRERMGSAGHDHVGKNFNQRTEAEKLADKFIRLSATRAAASFIADSVDIIMPTYFPNPVYLKRAIQSIINQTYSNWKLYLVQDGNDRDVRSLVDEIDDDRIQYFEMPHKGKPAALNFALSKGSSSHIAYLDDDDIWYPNHLQETVSYMARTGAKFVHTDSYEIFISTEGDRFEEISRRSLNKGVITNKTLWYISHINAVHERELLDQAGVYDDSMPFFIDWDMFQRLAKYAKPHHLNIYTCEHYMYLNKDKKESNTISSAHKKDPELSKRMHLEMFKRSFDLLSAQDFAEFVRDWQSKTNQLEQKSNELREKENLLRDNAKQLEGIITAQLYDKDKIIEDKQNKIIELHNSLSWRITAPLRWCFDNIYVKFKK